MKGKQRITSAFSRRLQPLPYSYTLLVTLHYLRTLPEHTETIAKWIYDTFPHEFEGTTFGEWLEQVRHPERITFVAVENGRALGTASLDFEDLPPRSDLTPWLASVYVLPEFRARGLGALLIEAVAKEAQARGFEQIYLHTSDRAEFYAKRGWSVLGTVEHWQKMNTVMVKNLSY
jgi:GNAT superfamily N-acetyltransferase